MNEVSEEKIRNEEVAAEEAQTSADVEEQQEKEDAKETVHEETEKDEQKKEEPKAEEDEDLQTKYLRLAADFKNFKRRSEKEKGDIYAYANEKIILELLDVIDNFERAMEHKDEAEETKLMEGMSMILKQLQDVLEKNHLKEIEALNQEFDPAYHHAVMEEESDSAQSGVVVKVLQKGYMLSKKVIRPSMVVVSK